MTFRTFKLRADPANQVTYANRDRIIDAGARRPLRPRPRPLTRCVRSSVRHPDALAADR